MDTTREQYRSCSKKPVSSHLERPESASLLLIRVACGQTREMLSRTQSPGERLTVIWIDRRTSVSTSGSLRIDKFMTMKGAASGRNHVGATRYAMLPKVRRGE